MVPKGLLKEWSHTTFQSATDYWTFRKLLTLQLALAGFAEYVLHLTRLNPDMLYIHQDSGLANVAYFKFDVDDVSGDLDGNRPVPFRLTPCLNEFLSEVGVKGPFTAAMISCARCFVHPNFKLRAFLRAVLRDEMIAYNKKNAPPFEELNQTGEMTPPQESKDREAVAGLVIKAVAAIMARLNSLSSFDGNEGKVVTLVQAASSVDNLCRMDPAWHPWL